MAAAAAVSTTAGELAIVLTDDSAIRQLNRDWRGKDAPTNVLSFPAPARERRRTRRCSATSSSPTRPTAREAHAEGKPFAHHLAHLAVHGFLHLLGYDHETDREADAMESLEARHPVAARRSRSLRIARRRILSIQDLTLQLHA